MTLKELQRLVHYRAISKLQDAGFYQVTFWQDTVSMQGNDRNIDTSQFPTPTRSHKASDRDTTYNTWKYHDIEITVHN